ncbi:ubiquitin C-terminal hydrolase 12-like isoform X1 [Pyrus communis]|uniref:ubiquitin C-terminal hydrolase 12-like isoform X1 n=1 Tax=Pyrus communis TaxID=23211 RepID=UPI0035BFF71E
MAINTHPTSAQGHKALHYTIIRVARDEDLAEQIGRDIYFDLVDHDKVRKFRIHEQMPFNLFKEEVAKEFGIPVRFQRFWIWAKRQNQTYRPHRPLTPGEESQSVGQLIEVSNKTHNAELRLFLEVEFGPDLRPIPPPVKTKEDILLFFKLYEPEKQELRFVGRFFVKSSSKPAEILGKLNQLAGFTPDEEIELYKEIKFEPCIMCEHLDKKTSFRLSQIEDGDIICFQKSTPLESEEECKYPDVPSFLEYVHNRQVVHFRSLEKPKEEDFSLELSKLHTYDDVMEKLARQIGLDDPTKIRLTAHNCYSQQPKPQPIKFRGVEHLTDMLVHYNQSSDILYYEVLDIPLPELQGLKNLKVAFHHATKDEIRLKKEQGEKEDKRKYKAQAHLYTIIKVARDVDLTEQIGRDIYFDLVDHDKVRNFRIEKQKSFNLFKEDVAKEFGIPVQFQRFWIWAKRQNHTYRPNRPLTPQEETQSVGQLREVSNKTHNAELKLFLEVEFGPDLRPIPPPVKTKEDILLFFKLYEPEKQELRFVGRFFVKSSSKPAEILGKLNQLAGFTPDEEIELYEEIKFEPCIMCEHLDKKTSFRLSQIEDGDIICFQKSTPLESEEECKYPDVPSFLEYVHNRQVVHFRSLEKPKEEDFSLELSKLHTYDDVVEKLARQIGLEDPTKIRLTAHNCYSQQPKPQPIKFRGVEHLTDMLVHYNQSSDILYYEVLDIPLPELQGLKNLKVAFHHATKDEVVIHNIRLPKQSTVGDGTMGDVINVLKTKVELSHPNAELRLLEVFYHKIYKILPYSEKIENINDQYWTLRAEEASSFLPLFFI